MDAMLQDALIDKLMINDPTFMYKFQLIKEELIHNLDDYASSIETISNTVDIKNVVNYTKENFNNVSGQLLDLSTSIGSIISSFSNVDVEGMVSGITDINSKGINSKFVALNDNMSDMIMRQDFDQKNTISKLDILNDNMSDMSKKRSEGVFDKDASHIIIDDISDSVLGKMINISADSFTNPLKGATIGKFPKMKSLGFKSLFNIKSWINSHIINMFGYGLGARLVSKFGLAGSSTLLLSAGALWLAVDGLKGYFTENDSSKMSNSLAGMVASDSLTANLSKMGIAGAGAGVEFGPVGVVAGALLGVALGAIMHFLGKDQIAKDLDKMWRYITNYYSKDAHEKRKLHRVASLLRNKTNSTFTTDEDIGEFIDEYKMQVLDGRSIKFFQKIGIDLLDEEDIEVLMKYEDDNIQSALEGVHIYDVWMDLKNKKLSDIDALAELEKIRKEMHDKWQDVEPMSVDSIYDNAEQAKLHKVVNSALLSMTGTGEETNSLLQKIQDTLMVKITAPQPTFTYDMGAIRDSTHDAAYEYKLDYLRKH